MNTSKGIVFGGFEQPKENWSKLPHELIDVLNTIETIGELKIILYILRHTWGYHDATKKITLDEFENGRKRKDGTRLDSGTGLSIPTIRNGISRAVAHGFISVEKDSSDPARVKNFYSLSERNLHPDYKNVSPCVQETLPRTEKDTLEKNKKKDQGDDPPAQPALSPAIAAYENTFGPITYKASELLKDDVDTYGETAVVEAIGKAKERRARSYAYVESILRNKSEETAVKQSGEELWQEVFKYQQHQIAFKELSPTAQTAVRGIGGESILRGVQVGFETDQMKKRIMSYAQQ